MQPRLPATRTYYMVGHIHQWSDFLHDSHVGSIEFEGQGRPYGYMQVYETWEEALAVAENPGLVFTFEASIDITDRT